MCADGFLRCCCYCCGCGWLFHCWAIAFQFTSGTLKVDTHLNVILRSKHSQSACIRVDLHSAFSLNRLIFFALFCFVLLSYSLLSFFPSPFFIFGAIMQLYKRNCAVFVCRHQIRLQKWRFYVSKYGANEIIKMEIQIRDTCASD